MPCYLLLLPSSKFQSLSKKSQNCHDGGGFLRLSREQFVCGVAKHTEGDKTTGPIM